jgi:hypothetical protein
MAGQNQNTKHQTPNTRKAPSFKLQELALKTARHDEQVCHRVNRLKRLSAEMAEWEKFDCSVSSRRDV